MLRATLIRAGESARLRELVARFPPTRGVVRRFIAGEHLDSGLAVVRALARSGRTATLDHLGESVTDPAAARAAADAYLEALDRIRREGLACGVSVKPTQMGLDIDPAVCRELVVRIAAAADAAGVHLTLDMEGSDTTERTVALVEHVVGQGYRDVGCALQAYLHRSEEDIARLNAVQASLRWCKGAYAEPPTIAWQSRAEVREAYARGAELLLREGTYPRFATHDDHLIDRIRTYAARTGVPRDGFEFQMLYGIRTALQEALVRDGYRLRVYVPFGQEWYPYFMRRLAERPANLVFFLRALLDR